MTRLPRAVAGSVPWALALGVAAAALPGHRPAVALAGCALVVQAAVRVAWPPAQPSPSGLAPPRRARRTPPVPPDTLSRMELVVAGARHPVGHSRERLVPLLAGLARTRLATHHGVVVVPGAASPAAVEAGRRLLGPEAWDTLRPDLVGPAGRWAHGSGEDDPRSLEAIEGLVRAVEGL